MALFLNLASKKSLPQCRQQQHRDSLALDGVSIQPRTSQANVIQPKQGAGDFAAERISDLGTLYFEFKIALKYVIRDRYRCSRGFWMLSRIHSVCERIRKEIRGNRDQSRDPLFAPIFPKIHRGPWKGNYGDS